MVIHNEYNVFGRPFCAACTPQARTLSFRCTNETHLHLQSQISSSASSLWLATLKLSYQKCQAPSAAYWTYRTYRTCRTYWTYWTYRAYRAYRTNLSPVGLARIVYTHRI